MTHCLLNRLFLDIFNLYHLAIIIRDRFQRTLFIILVLVIRRIKQHTSGRRLRRCMVEEDNLGVSLLQISTINTTCSEVRKF